eukprot:5655723-Pleurochrysis_carterae.AAC.2
MKANSPHPGRCVCLRSTIKRSPSKSAFRLCRKPRANTRPATRRCFQRRAPLPTLPPSSTDRTSLNY